MVHRNKVLDKRGDAESNEDILTVLKKNENNYVNSANYKFYFRQIFDEGSTQEEIFETVAKPIIEKVLCGSNGAIFAYGQTGTGKTYSITGKILEGNNDRGMISRTFNYIFETMRKTNELRFHLGVSSLEVYNELAFDLLNAEAFQKASRENRRVSLMENEVGNLKLRNLSIHTVASMGDVEYLLHVSEMNRTVADTPLNPLSSRSHCIHILYLNQLKVGSGQVVKSKLSLIDLSGSERVMKSRISGQILYEAKQINLSLHYLEQVIIALSDPSRTHIPYRNSLVTSLLKDSLSGECITVMITTLSLDPMHFEETISTCRFAQRVSLIKWVPCRLNLRRVNSWRSHSYSYNNLKCQTGDVILELEELRCEVVQLKHQLRSLKEDRDLTQSEKMACEKFVKDYKGTSCEYQYVPKDMATAKYCFKLLYSSLVTRNNQIDRENLVGINDIFVNSPLKRLDRRVRYADIIEVIENGINLLCTMMKENPVLGELAEQAVEEMDSSMIKKLAKILKLDTEPYTTAEIPQSQNQMGFTGTALLNSTNDDFIDFLCTPEMKSSVSNYIKMNAMNYAQLDSECSLWRISKDTINHLDIMYNQLEEQLRSDGNALEGINEKLTDLVERINREEDYLFSAHSQLEELRLRREDNLVVMAEAKKYLWKCYFIRKKEKELYRTGNEYDGEKCVTEEPGSEKEAKRGQEKVDGQKYSQKDFGILCKADKGLGMKNILTYNDREANEVSKPQFEYNKRLEKHVILGSRRHKQSFNSVNNLDPDTEPSGRSNNNFLYGSKYDLVNRELGKKESKPATLSVKPNEPLIGSVKASDSLITKIEGKKPSLNHCSIKECAPQANTNSNLNRAPAYLHDRMSIGSTSRETWADEKWKSTHKPNNCLVTNRLSDWSRNEKSRSLKEHITCSSTGQCENSSLRTKSSNDFEKEHRRNCIRTDNNGEIGMTDNPDNVLGQRPFGWRGYFTDRSQERSPKNQIASVIGGTTWQASPNHKSIQDRNQFENSVWNPEVSHCKMQKQISEDKVTLQRDSMMTGDPSIDEEIVKFYRVYGIQ